MFLQKGNEHDHEACLVFQKMQTLHQSFVDFAVLMSVLAGDPSLPLKALRA